MGVLCSNKLPKPTRDDTNRGHGHSVQVSPFFGSFKGFECVKFEFDIY